MKLRSPAALRGLGIGVLFAMAASLAPVLAQVAPTAPARVSFQISTGSTSGTYFPVGEMLAGLVSHPPGIGRCELPAVCGPAGLIVSTRTSEGSVSNVAAVNAGRVSSGLAQADVVALAIEGKGPFQAAGPARNIRAIANIYGETLHLVAASSAKIASVSDLAGKRVSLSSEGSGTIITARAVLAAYRLNERQLSANYDSADRASELLREGKLDAFFFVGGAPVSLVQQMLRQGAAVLVPIDGAGRDRLLAQQPRLSARRIPQGVYMGAPAIETVGVDALWIVRASEPDDVVYGIVKAVFNPANREMLEARQAGAHFFDPAQASNGLIAPLHPGAMRYFVEAGLVAPPPVPIPKPS